MILSSWCFLWSETTVPRRRGEVIGTARIIETVPFCFEPSETVLYIRSVRAKRPRTTWLYFPSSPLQEFEDGMHTLKPFRRFFMRTYKDSARIGYSQYRCLLFPAEHHPYSPHCPSILCVSCSCLTVPSNPIVPLCPNCSDIWRAESC